MISLRDYAKHRGVSPPTVSRAVKTKRLLKSVVYDRNGDPKIADVALADQEWEANTDLSRAPADVKERGLGVQTSAPKAGGADSTPPTTEGAAPSAGVDGKELSLSEASAEEKRWKAKMAELEYKRRAAELVEVGEVIEQVNDQYTIVRTKLLAVPGKLRQARPSLTHEDVAAIDEHIREALEELSADDVVASSPGNGAAA